MRLRELITEEDENWQSVELPRLEGEAKKAKKGAKVRPVGYDTHSMLIRSELLIKDFVLSGAPVKALGEHNALVWDESEQCNLWRGMAQTTAVRAGGGATHARWRRGRPAAWRRRR